MESREFKWTSVSQICYHLFDVIHKQNYHWRTLVDNESPSDLNFVFVNVLFYLDFFADVFVIRRVLLQFNKCSLTWATYIMIARDSKISWS